jgi:hypothetical protein
MIGAWDTVGALGAPGMLGQVFNRKKYAYHDVGLTPAIQHAYHALAVDERRKPFVPTLWKRPEAWSGVLEQAWFAGVHSNVGGSYWPDGLANEALHWIVEKAEGLGLELDSAYLANFRPCFNSKLHDSLSALYRAMGLVERSLGEHRADGEAIHQSVLDRMGHGPSRYSPANVTSFLRHSGGLPIVNTTRLHRGEPC